MNFSEALYHIKAGGRLQRAGWNGKGMYVYLVPGSVFTTTRPPLNNFYAADEEVTYLPHIDMRTVDGKHVPWLCSQTDMLADDWDIYQPPVTK